MAAIVMAGGPVAEAVYAEVAVRVAALASRGKSVGLGTILVGDDAGSKGYIAKKHEMCARYGLASMHIDVPADGSQADLLAAVARFNADPAVDAFIVQNPVPAGFDFNQAMVAVDPTKDADGLHPVNLGLLALGADAPRACTPAGIQAILAYYRVPVEGRHVVIVGRGPTIGRPLSMLLTLKQAQANAAVTVVHTGVPDWARYTREADIVVGAAGVPGMITPDVIGFGSCVVSGGIVWQGRKLLPDVDESCADVAGWITPRLGGVGVTTVAMLVRNTVACAERRPG